MPVKVQSVARSAHTENKHNKTEEKKYKDPLNSWGIRVLTYSSEIGATVNEIAPKMTFALWVPSFMYLGADIYDKYKNDKNEYSPSSKRAVKESIRQALTFFILPTAATIVGQKMTSPVGKLISDKLSINAKDGIYRHTKNVIEQATGDNFSTKESFKNFLRQSLENKVNELNATKKSDNIFKKTYRYFTGYFALTDSESKKLFAYAEKNADRVFDLREKLLNNINDKKIPAKVIKKYKEELAKMQNLYGEDFADKALKNALKDYQNHLIVKNKIIKTIGGVASCLLLTQPISYLVNTILMPKYITPGMEIISTKFKDSNLLRQHIEKENEKRKKEIQSDSILNVGENSLKHCSDPHCSAQHSEFPPEDQEHKRRQPTLQPHLTQEKKSLLK